MTRPPVQYQALARIGRSLPAVRGRGSIGRVMHRRAVSRGRVRHGEVWAIPMAGGHSMHVPATSSQAWQAGFTGRYDDPQIAMLCRFIRPSSLVVDVGASLGFYTVPLGKAAAARGATVLAVEPVPANAAVVADNVALNDLRGSVHVEQVGLGSAPGEFVMHVEMGGVGNASAVSDIPEHRRSEHFREGRSPVELTVPVVRLDDLVGGRPCSVIKLDVEGFEMEVLAGGEQVILESRPTIFGEFSVPWSRTRGVDPGTPLRWAEAHGYDAYAVRTIRTSRWSDARTVELVRLTSESPRSGGDLLLRPRPAT